MTTSIFNLLFDDFCDGALRSWNFDGYHKFNENFPTYPVSNFKYDKEKEDLIIEYAVTGFKKEEIEITVSGNILTISGTKSKEDIKDSVFFIHKSLAQRNFKHPWRIDERQDLNSLKTKLENGLLTITIPVKKQEKARKIKIGE